MSNENLPVAEISLSDIGKKFNGLWIFKDINYKISTGDRISISGNNGSGKSTFIQLLAGYITPSEGKISWRTSVDEIPVEKVYHHLSLATPYLELIEDFTLRENVDFYGRMKTLRNGYGTNDLLKIAKLEDAGDRQIKYFSSGMKQRVKLALAFLAESGLLLLDEPLSNLDAAGYEWYHEMMEKFLGNRILIVCSNNVADETRYCTRHINIENFKQY